MPHDLQDNVVKIILYQQFFLSIFKEKLETFKQEIAAMLSDLTSIDTYLNKHVIVNHLQQYKKYLIKVFTVIKV